MTFPDINQAFSDLRDGLRTQIGREAMADVNIRPPATDCDEAAFLRLTAWNFALLFEAGRISIPFLLSLKFQVPNSDQSKHKKTRDIVQYLRTYQFHNLGFDDGHDLDVRKSVSQWCLQTCGVLYPGKTDEWRACFERLCKDVHGLLSHCSAVLSIVARSPEDRDTIFADLRRRLNRDWPAHQFDRIIEDSAARLGEQINSKAFRERRISDWRNLLMAMPDEADLENEMERIVDGEISDYFRSRLPISTRDLIASLGLDPGPDVKRAIGIARRLFDSGVRDRNELIAGTGAEIEQAAGIGPEVPERAPGQ